MKKLDPEKINNDLIVKSLAGISQLGEAGAILVFLPGLMEISKCLGEYLSAGAPAGSGRQ